MTDVRTREAPEARIRQLTDAGVHPLLARIYAGRGIAEPAELDYALGGLLPWELLHGADAMARVLADAIRDGTRLLVVADYDCDGATACAVGLRALRAFGARVDYIVPNRFEFGYGLTPEIVAFAYRAKPADILVTVDNGIAAVEGVDAANRLGLQVLVTDHHLPGDRLPDATCIVNPNQPGCGFPSKHLAGVGVMFYVMLALRAELRRRGAFATRPEPNLADLLDLVALGTVADVVRLDRNNRALVHQGLRRIRAGRMQPGIAALFRAAGRDSQAAATYDLGFVLGPRVNAAGRLDDMALGIECLSTEDGSRADAIAAQLDSLNRERRAIETDMRAAALDRLDVEALQRRCSVSLFQPDWHQGVIGILAGRIKDQLHRPVIAFARGSGGELKGSGRSIRGLHLRDALDLIDRRLPGLILRFGGHAAAAGLSIPEHRFPEFTDAFESVVAALVSPSDLERLIETDGSLPAGEITLDTARRLQSEIWGQGFPAPLFDDTFSVESQRIVGERHLRLRLARDGRRVDAILFNHVDPLPGRMRAIYRLGVNEFRGNATAQLTIERVLDEA
jgi:single-stranded-DNA-specific exonuclease